MGPRGEVDHGRDRKSSLCSRQAEEYEVRSGPDPLGKGVGLDGVGNSSIAGLSGGGAAACETNCRSGDGLPSRITKDPPCIVLEVHLKSSDKPHFPAQLSLSEVAPTNFARLMCDGRQLHSSA